jgi:hypothetical protein
VTETISRKVFITSRMIRGELTDLVIGDHFIIMDAPHTMWEVSEVLPEGSLMKIVNKQVEHLDHWLQDSVRKWNNE